MLLSSCVLTVLYSWIAVSMNLTCLSRPLLKPGRIFITWYNSGELEGYSQFSFAIPNSVLMMKYWKIITWMYSIWQSQGFTHHEPGTVLNIFYTLSYLTLTKSLWDSYYYYLCFLWETKIWRSYKTFWDHRSYRIEKAWTQMQFYLMPESGLHSILFH